ncbi:predicted protein [Scheffersomyces stipitis CBS 6054]|uniref:Mitochondrial outer membrane transport complex Sam37/metaxin N-terminal domain-containing protein n=1 Tax=Scheffersomyces stipitis (strain ATCC 58785 / CBS 6054 / NBRC 10063 / NRRL Y-11545) TaxID=322104 RepID=A3LTE5_PICST|nr:predicted protein [Scheffersomyces stipitis CBS 6054]ABN66390.2 predicted protein [Scheffersomyces stipitis CBS 6054]
MIQLHVWGCGTEISVISPECLAASWLLTDSLSNTSEEYEIVTSSNTNVSDIGKLPVLTTAERKLQGFEEISKYILETYGDTNFVSKELSTHNQLVNKALIAKLQYKVEYIHQYNMFVNSRNYEKYTTKLFQKYLPFPMMYNQPLKLHQNAQEQVQLLGLNKNKTGFFDFSGSVNNSEIAETEYINDENEEQDEVALSALHERQLVAKSKEKSLLRESKNSLKCLHLLNDYLDYFSKLYEKLNGNKNSYGFIFDQKRASSCEILLCAYVYSLTYEDLPDRFIYNYLKIKRPDFTEFIATCTQRWNTQLQIEDAVRGPENEETPSLWNEVKYQTGIVHY